MKLRAPSPALVVSIIALVVACAGTAVAATTIIKRSSQVRSGVIINRHLKNSTIQTTKLSKSTLRRIDASSGISAIEAIRKNGPENQPANQVIKVASLTVPAGAYVIHAKTTLTSFPPATPLLDPGLSVATGHCRLDAAGDVDDAVGVVVVNNRQSPATIHTQVTRSVGGSSEIKLECDSSNAPWRASDTSIIATKVSDLKRVDASG